MSDLSALIARLEGLTGPDRVMDIAVLEACFPDPDERWNWIGDPHDRGGAQSTEFTDSIDDTVALVEKMTGNESWRVGNLRPWAAPKAAFALLGTNTTEHHGATPAIALLIALLRALEKRG